MRDEAVAKENEVQNTPTLQHAQKRKGLLYLSFLCRLPKQSVIKQDIIVQK